MRRTMISAVVAAVAGLHHNDVLVLHGGDRMDGIYRFSRDGLHNGAPAFDCFETGSDLTLNQARTSWEIAFDGDVLAARSGQSVLHAAQGPPEGQWASADGATSFQLFVLRPGFCISDYDAILALNDVVGHRLTDAEELSAAMRPASTAEAYKSAQALAALRCSGVPASIAEVPHSLAVIASGWMHMKLGQVLRGIPRHHPKYPGSVAAAIEALETAVERMVRIGAARGRRKGGVDPATLLFTQLVLGHAHLARGEGDEPEEEGGSSSSSSKVSGSGKGHVHAAIRAFRGAAATSPTSLAATANLGRAYVLLARRHCKPAGLAANRTLEAAVATFHRLLGLLEAQAMPYRARRDDSFGDARNIPLWWADALLSLGQALQILGAASQERYLASDGYKQQLGSPPSTGPPPPAWQRPGWLAPGNRLLTAAARRVYERGVTIGLWDNPWQRWNVEPPVALPHEKKGPAEQGLATTSTTTTTSSSSKPWLDRHVLADRDVYPHAAAATLEGAWREMRDEIVSWHASMRTNLTSFDAAAGEDDETLLHTGQWRLLRFLHPASEGWVRAAKRAAPKTYKVLRRIPALRGCAARNCTELTAQLSHLVKGSHIAPHCGRGRLSLMLPLVAPRGCCRLQAGSGPPRELVEGKVLVFDDSWEHQAWADADRMVLIVDVPRGRVA